MKTYFRLLSFAKPFGFYLPLYLTFSLLTVLFGLVNFSLLVPLLNTLFGTVQIPDKIEVPNFALNAEYFQALFNYYFLSIIQERGSVGALGFVCLMVVASTFMKNIFRYLSDNILAILRTRVVRNLRQSVYDAIIRLHLGYFTEARKGDLSSRMTNDVQEVENSVISTFTVAFREPATIIGFFVLLFSMSVELTFFTLLTFPLSGLIIATITRRLKRQAAKGQQELGILLTHIDEMLTGFKIIKAFTAEEYVTKKFSDSNSRYASNLRRMLFQKDAGSPLSEALGVSAVAGILFYGGSLVLQNESELGPGDFITYIILISQVLVPVKAISSAFSNIQRGLVSGERILQIIDTQPAIQDAPNAIAKTSFDKSLRFEEVSFHYIPERPVLQAVNFEVPKGKTVALVGPSGSGKSTIVDLVPRFYEPQSGRITLDGIDVNQLTMRSLRQFMGIVTQEPILFNDTIYNNIAFGNEHATEADVIQAAKIANAHEFITETPGGYQTTIGDRGVKLSGGQRQRLSIARAVLKNPPILILDEATSALDNESEKLVQGALNNLMQNRTAIVIAHRLSTIQSADEILVIDQGKVVERGTHAQLLALEGGLYRKLSELQGT